VLSISLAKDMNNFGLLMVIGLTRKQLKKMVFRQNMIILLFGILSGLILSILAGIFVFPRLFENLLLKQYGQLEVQTVFYPHYLIGAAVISSLMLLSASKYILDKLKNRSPLSAYRYQAKEISLRKERRSAYGASISKMAWYNLWNSKRKFIITMISLFMGCETVMLAGFIMNGTNLINEFSQSPDFEIGTQKEAVDNYLFPYRNANGLQIDQESPLFDETVVQKVAELPEIDKNSLNIVYGCYAAYDYSEDYIQPIENIVYENGTPNNVMTIQVLDDQSIDLLENYVKKNRLDIDLEALRDGDGLLVLHKHELSETLEDDAGKMKGEPAHVFPVDSAEQNGVEFICSGYLDTTAKGFPQLNMSWEGDGFHYFLISEKGYKRLGFLKQIFHINADAKKGQETAAAEKLTELVRNENARQENYNIYYLSRTADKIRETEDYMETGMDTMNAFSLCLLLLGVINYINTILTNIAARKSEFGIMRCIGMTRKQLRRMLIMEGVYYWCILQVLLLTVGSTIDVGAGFIIRNNLSYFTFVFPLKEWIMISAITIILCVCIPQIMYMISILRNRRKHAGN
jgi:putative ABC transport system permease protein